MKKTFKTPMVLEKPSPHGVLWNYAETLGQLNLCPSYQGGYWWSKKIEMNITSLFWNASLWDKS